MVRSENIDKSTSWPWARRTDGGGWGFSLLLMLDFTLAWSAASGCVLHTGTPGWYWSARENPVICPAQFCLSKAGESRNRGIIHRLEQRPKKTQRGQKVSGVAFRAVGAVRQNYFKKTKKIVPATSLKSNPPICWSIGRSSGGGGTTCCSPSHVTRCAIDRGWRTVFQTTTISCLRSFRVSLHWAILLEAPSAVQVWRTSINWTFKYRRASPTSQNNCVRGRVTFDPQL